MPTAPRPKSLRGLRQRATRSAPRPRSRRAARVEKIDPITTEIVLGAFETICYEMAQHASLTAHTPTAGIPQFMLSSTLPVRFAVEFFGPGGLFDGDVMLANDPYHGGGHLPDHHVFAPVFHHGGG